MSKPMPHQPVQQTLFRLRVRYGKRGRLAYLGHLEVMHTIERIVRRAGLAYAVTQGFSPRMRAGFSSALPVGTSSTCEWYDLFLTRLVPAREALARLQEASPEELAPDLAAYIAVRAPALTAQITRVRYRVELSGARGDVDLRDVESALAAVVNRERIPYARGKKDKVLDLGKLLVSTEVREAGPGRIELDIDSRCDNEGALRPEILIAALDRELLASRDPIVSTGIQALEAFDRYAVERTAQLIEDDDGRLLEPL